MATMSKTKPPARPLTVLATTLEVCEYLSISRETLYRLMRRGEAPRATKVGRAWRWDWADVESWQRKHQKVAA